MCKFTREKAQRQRIMRSSHWKCSVKKGVLKNSQYSQENTRVRVSFNKAASLQACSYFIKRL